MNCINHLIPHSKTAQKCPPEIPWHALIAKIFGVGKMEPDSTESYDYSIVVRPRMPYKLTVCIIRYIYFYSEDFLYSIYKTVLKDV